MPTLRLPFSLPWMSGLIASRSTVPACLFGANLRPSVPASVNVTETAPAPGRCACWAAAGTVGIVAGVAGVAGTAAGGSHCDFCVGAW